MKGVPLPGKPNANSAPRDSIVLLGALGVLAYAASTMTHEVLGHGMYCVAAGGHNTMFSMWQETCHFPAVPPVAVKAAGPAVQFAAGLLAWAILQLRRIPSARLRFFLWLYMAYDLLIASSYLVFSGVTGFGDAADLVAGLPHEALWRTAVILLGCALYLIGILLSAITLNLFSGLDDDPSRLYRLIWILYVTVGAFACCCAALNKVIDPGDAITMASLSSFGSGSGLFCLPGLRARLPGRAWSQTASIPWSTVWCVAAVVILAAFTFVIGPGLLMKATL